MGKSYLAQIISNKKTIEYKLKDLPKHMRTKEWIKSEIRYEEYGEINPNNMCGCKRQSYRVFLCSLCWRDLLKRKRGKKCIKR